MSDPSLWVDVRVSATCTEALVHELLAAAAAVEAALALLDPAVVGPEVWGGPHRRVFDAERDVLRRRGADLAAALVATAQRAGALLAAGESEQRLREGIRHRIEVAARPPGAS